MKKAFVYQTALNQPKTGRIMGPVAQGLARHGYTTELRESQRYPQGDEEAADILAIWGDYHGSQKIYADHLSSPRLLHVDNGYLGRGHFSGYYSVTLGQKQTTTTLWQGQTPRRDRLHRLHITCHPWRRTGNKVLALGLSRKQCENLDVPYPQWNKDLQNKVRHVSGRPVVLREKRYDRLQPPLMEVLLAEDWRCVVGHTSKGLIEALIAGLPIVSLAPCAASALSSEDLYRLAYPENRTDFLTRLAYHQWTLAEIAAGEPWETGRLVCE